MINRLAAFAEFVNYFVEMKTLSGLYDST